MFKVLNLFLIILSLNNPAFGKTPVKIEQISVKMKTSGDFKAEYDFSGPIGSLIKATSADSNPACDFASLFRKVKYRGKPSVEAWLQLECVFEGQKNSYKTHRVFLNADPSSQKMKLPMLDKNLKNVQLEFSELTLKPAKK